MDRLTELLQSDMIARGKRGEKKSESVEKKPDRYEGARGKYGEIKASECRQIAEAIKLHHNTLAKLGGGVSALNTDIYDIDGDFALYQTRIFIKAESQRYAKTKIRYWLARFERGEIAENRALEINGQTIHYFIRNGLSPIASLRAEGKL